MVCGYGFDETAIDGAFRVEEVACEAISKVRRSGIDDCEREVVDVRESLVRIEMKAAQDCGFETFGCVRP
jgi:hypothetical protein